MFKYIALILALTAFGTLLVQQQGSQNMRGDKKQFYFNQYQNWKLDFNQNYNVEEDQVRFQNFMETFKFIQRANEEEGYEVVGLNPMAALSKEEYRELYLIKSEFLQQEMKEQQFVKYLTEVGADDPSQVDWVKKGAVAVPTEAGSCNSSYAIASTGAMASLYQIRKGSLKQLSAQQCISCDTISVGCRGGSDMYCYLYAMQYGIQTEQSYPYTSSKGSTGQCLYDQSETLYKPDNTFEIHYNMPLVMQHYLSEQPITAWVDGSSDYFRNYRGGDKPLSSGFCATESNEVNYITLLVGYNNDAEVPYWIVQSSFGPKWGNDGYMFLKKKDSGAGVCNVNHRVRFPGYQNE